MFDREGRIVYASAACGRWLGIDPERLIGLSGWSPGPSSATAVDLAESADVFQAIAAALASPAGVDRGEIAVQTVRPPAASPTLPPPPPRQVLYVPLLTSGPTSDASADSKVSSGSNLPQPSLPEGSRAAGGRPTIMAFADLALPPPATAETHESRLLVDEVNRQWAASGHRGSSILTLGSSVAAQRLNRQIELASRFFTHVTLVGPAGNPVEGIVRRIHAATPDPATPDPVGADLVRPDRVRPDRVVEIESSGEAVSPAGSVPFPRSLHPGQLVPVAGPLMDAELFDATTASLADRLLEAETATAAVLIHEIDQMPRDAQERLELLIHNHPQRLRVFATSTRSTTEMADSLLPSLAALLSTFELAVPALGERVEDIPLLATALLERRRGAGETRAEQLGRDALDRLVLYPWPGNFSELDAAIRSAARQCRGETIRVEHLPLAIRSYGAAPAAPAATPRTTMLPLDQALERLERELISRALEQAAGNRAAAARILQISRPRLLRRIEQLGLEQLGIEQPGIEQPGLGGGERDATSAESADK